jgi:hypothetical protein
MPVKTDSTIPPQKDVLTLEEAMQRTGNWKKFINTLYQGKDKNMPHGIFIPFTDILELSKLQQLVKEITVPPSTEVIRIYIVGVRAYYSLKKEVVVPIPVSAADYPVEALFVAVYQTNYREPGSPSEYEYDPGYETYDLIIPVPSVNNTFADNNTSSIYDITQPCPPLCNSSSPLY